MPARRGPRFEITREMAIENIRRVMQRVGLTTISWRLYDQHGSFSARVIQRKFGWTQILAEAGIHSAANGRRKKSRQACMQTCGRLSMTTGRHCRTCRRRILRQRADDSTE